MDWPHVVHVYNIKHKYFLLITTASEYTDSIQTSAAHTNTRLQNKQKAHPPDSQHRLFVFHRPSPLASRQQPAGPWSAEHTEMDHSMSKYLLLIM